MKALFVVFALLAVQLASAQETTELWPYLQQFIPAAQHTPGMVSMKASDTADSTRIELGCTDNVSGSRNGLWLAFDAKGYLSSIDWFENGQVHKSWKEYSREQLKNLTRFIAAQNTSSVTIHLEYRTMYAIRFPIQTDQELLLCIDHHRISNVGKLVSGKLHGRFVQFDSAGLTAVIAPYERGLLHGELMVYKQPGNKIRARVDYTKGRMIRKRKMTRYGMGQFADVEEGFYPMYATRNAEPNPKIWPTFSQIDWEEFYYQEHEYAFRGGPVMGRYFNGVYGLLTENKSEIQMYQDPDELIEEIPR